MKLKISVPDSNCCMATVALSGCSSKAPPEEATDAPSGETAEYHIGIVTGTYSREKMQLGSERLVEIYGAVEDGGIIKHLPFPITLHPSKKPDNT